MNDVLSFLRGVKAFKDSYLKDIRLRRSLFLKQDQYSLSLDCLMPACLIYFYYQKYVCKDQTVKAHVIMDYHRTDSYKTAVFRRCVIR